MRYNCAAGIVGHLVSLWMTQPPGSASSAPPGQPAVPYHLWRQQNGFPAGNAAPSSINGAGAGAAAPDPRLALLHMYMNYKAAAAAAPAAGIASHPPHQSPFAAPSNPPLWPMHVRMNQQDLDLSPTALA